MTAPALPQLDTPEARWSYVLTLWHTRGLPTPESIAVDERGNVTVWLPCNERGQVDQWANALDIQRAPFLHDARNEDSTTRPSVGYSTHGKNANALCYVDLTADAEVHGLVGRSELATAADGVVAMLAEDECEDCGKHACTCEWGGAFLFACPTCGAQPKNWCTVGVLDDPLTPHADRAALYVADGEPVEAHIVCNNRLGVEAFCALDAGHTGDCDPSGHATVPAEALAWLNAADRSFTDILHQPWVATVAETGGVPDEVELLDSRRLIRVDGQWTLRGPIAQWLDVDEELYDATRDGGA